MTPVHTHRSTAFVKPIGERGTAWKPDAITSQFRFIIRMAYACHEQQVAYDVTWKLADSVMRATIEAMGNIPTPKPLPKAPRLKIVADWKPTLWDAAYRLDAYHDANLKRRCPGFVIEHSCGLSLVHPSESDELGGDDSDIRQNWRVTHTASGMGFGLTLSFKRAVSALLHAASFNVDFTLDAATLKGNSELQRAGNTVIATYGRGFDRDNARRKLAELERVA